jgi:hypothetical protein
MNFKRTIGIFIIVVFVSNQIQIIFASVEKDLENQIITETQNLIPLSIQMIDQAVDNLKDDSSQMSPEAQDLFNDIFDPGDTGCIDQIYINQVSKNYIRIRQHLEKPLSLVYAPNSDKCRGMRLYYTNFVKIFVCPYFLEEDSMERKARNLIHEIAHLELLALDRSYYDPKSYSTRYHALMPRGSVYTTIPVIGHIIREIQRSDTLYHPDAYAWFAGLSFAMISDL